MQDEAAAKASRNVAKFHKRYYCTDAMSDHLHIESVVDFPIWHAETETNSDILNVNSSSSYFDSPQ